jgi:hypothetical protein
MRTLLTTAFTDTVGATKPGGVALVSIMNGTFLLTDNY